MSRHAVGLDFLRCIFAVDSVGLSAFKVFQWAPKRESFIHQCAYRPFKVIQGR